MVNQSFETHAHRPTATIVGYLFVIMALTAFAFRWSGTGGRTAFAIGLLGVVGAEITLLYISRAFITRLQDRIIRLEMRVRCGPLLSPEQQQQLAGLSVKQVTALRFASDSEIPALLERAHRERLSPAHIKRAVVAWTPDHERT